MLTRCALSSFPGSSAPLGIFKLQLPFPKALIPTPLSALLLVGAAFSHLASLLRSSSCSPALRLQQNLSVKAKLLLWGHQGLVPSTSRQKAPSLLPAGSSTGVPAGQMSFSWGLNRSLRDWKSSSPPAAGTEPRPALCMATAQPRGARSIKIRTRRCFPPLLLGSRVFIPDPPSGAVLECNPVLQRKTCKSLPGPGDAETPAGSLPPPQLEKGCRVRSVHLFPSPLLRPNTGTTPQEPPISLPGGYGRAQRRPRASTAASEHTATPGTG